MKLTRNIVKCLVCGDVIESRSNYEHKQCSCGRLSVDGGTVAPRIIGEEKDYEVMYEYATQDVENQYFEDNRTQFDNVDLDIPVKEVGFNVRTLNAFDYYNRSDSPMRKELGAIHTLGDMKNYKIQHLRMFRNLGVASVKHIEDVLKTFRIKLPN